MSGTKRNSKYRKSVESEILNTLPEPDSSRNEFICRVLGSRGGNILEVESPPQAQNRMDQLPTEIELCRLPSRFRNVIWVKRGSFLICERAASSEDKVQFVCNHVLFSPESIKNLKQKQLFPSVFMVEDRSSLKSDEEEEEEEDLATIRNPNRKQREEVANSSSSDDEDED